MKLTSKLLAVAGVCGVGMLARRWRAQRAPGDVRAQGDVRAPDMSPIGGVEIPTMGISDVDPEPMTQISGEGIDPDMVIPHRIR